MADEPASDVPVVVDRDTVPAEPYRELLDAVAEQFQTAQGRAARALNAEIIRAYWQIGTEISVRIRDRGWGAGVIERLSRDLRTRFSGARGFSVSNLRYMRAFAEAWSASDVSAGPPGALPWVHNITLLSIKDPAARLFYAQQAVEHGWSRPTLEHFVGTDLFGREGKAISNFDQALPAPAARAAQQITKDPYSLEFLALSADAQERDLEDALLGDIQKFLLELGVGFAFYGRQHPLIVGGQEFFLDLLFYHHRLRRFVVIDLKIGRFEPEFAGKMNFYLNAVDEQMRLGDDQESIGLILCTSKSETIAKLALRGVDTPIAVSDYVPGEARVTDEVPNTLRKELPLPELKAEVEGVVARRSEEEHDDQLSLEDALE